VSSWYLACGSDHSAFIENGTGKLFVFGRGGDGQLGIGPVTVSTTVRQVGSGTSWKVVAGDGFFTAGIA
jgi:alpha-tubulin suppressor-like RCC1 family protein